MKSLYKNDAPRGARVLLQKNLKGFLQNVRVKESLFFLSQLLCLGLNTYCLFTLYVNDDFKQEYLIVLIYLRV